VLSGETQAAFKELVVTSEMFNALGEPTLTLPSELSVAPCEAGLEALAVAVAVGDGVADADMVVFGLLSSLLAGVEQAANESNAKPVTTDADTIGISFFMVS
jgi:hypothetical protein